VPRSKGGFGRPFLRHHSYPGFNGDMRGWAPVLLRLMLPAAVLCLAIGRPGIAVAAAPAMGVLSGRVTRGPLSPVEVPGMPQVVNPVAGARIVIERPGTTLARSIKTDSRGAYRMVLPPGVYRVTMPSLYGSMFTKDLPATIKITSGERTRFNIHLDTGIR
jgi:hypothetical protein